MGPEASIQKKLDVDTGWGAAIVITGALAVGYLTQGAVLAPPFWLLLVPAAVFGWALLAFLARAVFARHAQHISTGSPLLLHWVGSRLAIFAAGWLLFIGWIISLPIGRPWSGIAGRALVLVLVLSALNSLIGQATINSAILIARFRRTH